MARGGELPVSGEGAPESAAEVASRLRALPGVREAVVHGPPWRALVVWQGEPNATRAEWAVRNGLRGVRGLEELVLEFAFLTPPEPRRRVRFVEVEVTQTGPSAAAVNVVVEWGGARFTGMAEGEYAGGVADLRLTVAATLHALEATVGDGLDVRGVGVKQLRIFDQHMVVVLLQTEAGTSRPLVGSCLAGGDVHGAAVLAVLNATNRLLGNYLHVSD